MATRDESAPHPNTPSPSGTRDRLAAVPAGGWLKSSSPQQHRWTMAFARHLARIASVAALVAGIAPAIAQDSPPPPAQQQSAQTVLFVNPERGDDSADGSAQTPLRTIARALAQARPGTTVQLVPGTYSAESGETLPLQIPPGVTLQGTPQARGHGVILSGGGPWQPAGDRPVALVVGPGTTAAGLTIANPEGIGVWIAGTGTLANSTLTRNGSAGIAIASGSPRVAANFLRGNPNTGAIAFGRATPELDGNVIEGSRIGIRVLQEAAPILSGNQLRGNDVGINVEGSARPVVRGNRIENSSNTGLSATATARPAVAGNTFRNNARDIYNDTGRDFATAPPASLAIATPPPPTAAPATEPTPTTPDEPAATVDAIAPSPAESAPTDSPTTELAPTALNEPAATADAIAPTPAESVATAPQPTPLPEPVPRSTPRATPSGGRQLSDLLVLQPGLLPGATPTPPPPAAAAPTPAPTSGFRVIARAETPEQAALVRQIEPAAFAIAHEGRSAIQVGIFSSRASAERVVQRLREAGIESAIVTR